MGLKRSKKGLKKEENWLVIAQKKRILFVVQGLSKGGMERRVLELIGALSKRNDFLCRVIVQNSSIEYSYIYDMDVVLDVYNKSKLERFLSFFKIYLIARDWQPDLIHTWGSLSALFSVPTKVLLKIPIINNQITSSTPVRNRLSKLINFFNFKFSNFILSNSEAGLLAYNPPPHKSGVIHNGMNLERFNVQACAIKEEIGIPEDSLIVVMVSRFSLGKDYDTLLEVARKVCEVIANLYFLLVGDGPERPRIQSKAEAMRITERVKLLGKRKDVEAILLSSDIGVLLSNVSIVTEGLSNAVMEYMAAGLPVIATNAGGNPEIVDHGVTGYLVNDKDANQISEFALKLATNLVLRKEMGDRGKARIINEFSIDKFVDSHIDVIDYVINGSK
jgi:glycosyltransferase involved in cell wall biosynthesis